MYTGLPNLGLSSPQQDRPALDLNFLKEASDARITFSGGANGTRFDSTGTLVAKTCPRIDYDPVTLACKGLLIEEARTNSIRNNTMVGAVAGTPGTLPTNWTNILLSATQTLSNVTLATGGINTIDWRISGTTSGSGSVLVQFDLPSVAVGQTWTESVFLALVGGTLSNVSQIRLYNQEYNGGSFLQTDFGSDIKASLTSSVQRFSLTNTLDQATVNTVRTGLAITVTGAVALNLTLRVGLPQMEQGVFATSPILTSTVAVTRSADSASMTGTNFSSWYNQTGGAFVAEARTINSSANRFVFDATGADTTNAVSHYVTATTNTFSNEVTTGGVLQGVVFGGTMTPGTSWKGAMAFGTNDIRAAANGASIGTPDTAATLPTVDRFTIGRRMGGSFCLNGHVRRIRFYNTIRSSADLVRFTT